MPPVNRDGTRFLSERISSLIVLYRRVIGHAPRRHENSASSKAKIDVALRFFLARTLMYTYACQRKKDKEKRRSLMNRSRPWVKHGLYNPLKI